MKLAEYNMCVENLANDLYRYASRLVNNRETGRDIVQEVFARIWTKKDSVRFDEAKNYFFRATYNACMDHLRRLKTESKYMEGQTLTLNSTSASEQFELQDMLARALSQLKEKQRALIMLRDYEGYNYQEIGEITGLSESQVKVYIFRARKALKSIIKKVSHYER